MNSEGQIMACGDIEKLYKECLLGDTDSYCKWINYRYKTCSIMCNYKNRELCDRYIKIVGNDIVKTINRNK